MIYNIDYKVTDPVVIVSIKGYPTEEGATTAKQGDDVARCIARTVGDIASLGQPVLDALAAFKAKKDQTIEATPEVLWAILNPPPKAAREPKQKKANGGLTAPTNDTTSSDIGDGAGSKEKRMAAKKKVAKKKAAKAKSGTKKSTGPRGEKTLKIKSMLERKSGCTRAQVLEATGWPSVSMQSMAKSCQLKLRQEKVKGSPIVYFGTPLK